MRRTAIRPPFQGEGWGGDGARINRRCRYGSGATHPHPDLPLEGEGAFVEGGHDRLWRLDLTNCSQPKAD